MYFRVRRLTSEYIDFNGNYHNHDDFQMPFSIFVFSKRIS